MLSLCRQFPESVGESLVKKLACRDHEVIAFNVFRSSVYVCVVLQGTVLAYHSSTDAKFHELFLHGNY